MDDASPIEQRHHAVRRTARVAVLGSDDATELWIVCHGYGQLAARFLRRFAPIAAADRRIVAPEALNRFYVDGRIGSHGPDARVGATWMTREDRLTDIADYIGYLDTIHDLYATSSVTRVVALGFSQGTATVARWAAATARRIDHVVIWAGGLPPELAPEPGLFGSARLTLVAGSADRMVPPAAADGMAGRLAAAGRAADRIVHTGAHEIDADALTELARRVRVGRTV